MLSLDTIAAISTAPGTGAIAIVRVSGLQALPMAKKIFRSQLSPAEASPEQSSLAKSHQARHGYVIDPDSGQVIDEVVVIAYLAPHSYTGEDLVEINCHGGTLISREILSLCLRSGARLARPGEFTQRAFLSGRMDLTQAEAVLDLIQARTSRQRSLALSTLSGHLGQRIAQVRSRLMELLAAIVAGLDFPEEIGDAPVDHIDKLVESSLQELTRLAKTADSGRFLREGVRLTIAGRVNAGKSSLLNQLLNFDRAIVTDIPGTTRDCLEEFLDLNGIPVILVDTAGIRHTQDAVEQIGIKRTHDAIAQSDLVLMLVDLTQGWGQPEEEILPALKGKPYILIGNKIDLQPDHALPWPAASAVSQLAISALSGQGMNDLSLAIENWVLGERPSSDGQNSLNARQAELCARAAQALTAVQSTLAAGMPQDCLAGDLKMAIDNLSEICGEAVSEEVIHQVFASFCIGK